MEFLALALAYLIGSIPFGYLTGRLIGGIDIRKHGSGNIGATNVGRLMGLRYFFLVFVLDLLKGALPVWLLTPALLGPAFPGLIHWKVAAGVATVVGHMFPCWLGFRGGKGVATALGVVICLGPWASLVATVVFIASFAIWRYVSLASMLAAAAFGGYELYLLMPEPFSRETWSIAAFSLAVPLLIVLRHTSNIRRLIRGEERKFKRKPKPSDTAPQGA